ncbi:hypothetical protein AVEN_165585-1 [Araneus ventricosus]|uniref:Uncharacterized protein n=1 Tax=Araneus ventricosus TaxID=182803 RepID=A0A4Y2ELE4_ARAVE|nr:hypothetical protein AVEN_165585-1 [Araneus ventricosus]
MHGLFIAFPSYYCFVCWCIKFLFSDFQSKSKDLIKLQDYRRILEAYEELNEAMTLANSSLSYPMFIEVLVGMVKLFWFGCNFAFMREPDTQASIFFCFGIVQSLTLLSIVLLPAAAVNKAAYLAWEVVISLPAWFPMRYKKIKMYVHQRFVSNVSLTLWDIYRIDKSLFITALGTILTYGVLLATLGNTQNPKNDNSSTNNLYIQQ